MAVVTPQDMQTAERMYRSRRLVITVLATLGAAALGLSMAQLVYGNGVAVFALGAVAIAIVVWMTPSAGVVLLIAGAAVIEQFSLVSEGTFSDGTDRIPFFQSLNASAGLGGLYASPLEFFLVLMLAVWLIKGFATRTLALPRSWMSLSLATFAVLVALGWVRGILGGGSVQDSLLELRPWLYLVIAFVVTSQLITTDRQLWTLLAVLAGGIGVKGIQGVVTLLTHSARPQAILAHEESFFFGLFLAVLAGLWIIPIKGRLRTFMTVLAPFVLVADIANQRRTAWAIAAAVLIAVFVLCFAAFPERRRHIAGFAFIGCVLAGGYWVGFSNDPGLLGQPARAVLSQIAPSSRDQQSNQYRTVENVNLGVAIRQSMPFGTGFGHLIPQTVPNVDISNIDSFINYLPHNGVLYIWLRLGLAGIVAFWLMVGLAIMTAINTFRHPQGQIGVLISLTMLVALVAYVTQGFYDMGLYWFRIAIVVGCLAGALEAVRRINRTRTVTEPPAPLPDRAIRPIEAAQLGHAA